MFTLNPQFIKDATGKNSHVVLCVKEYKQLLEDMEELEDIQAYDEAKANDDGVRISLSDYLKQREECKQDA